MTLPAAVALSGLNEEYFSDGLDDVFNHGAVLLKSPSLSSVASSEDNMSQESGISSMSTSSRRCSIVKNVQNLSQFFDLLDKQIELQSVSPAPCSPTEETEHSCDCSSKIVYEKRDILDLASNIGWKWDLRFAELEQNPKYFLENRSQFSRVLGVEIPEHGIITCSIDECSFEEPRYE